MELGVLQCSRLLMPGTALQSNLIEVAKDILSSSTQYNRMKAPLAPSCKYVIGPDGSPLTTADLPAPGTKRWVIRRKAQVVLAVRGGLLSLEDACNRYMLTADEFLSWQASIEQHGLAGLRTTRIQQYRS
jgi:hypothetical protein